MSKYVSFFVLLAVIGILFVLFYRVMASFFVPLFLAVLLVVIFGPMHNWILVKCNHRAALASALTTLLILLLVLTPLALLFGLAATEGQTLLRRFSPETVVSQALKLRDSTGLTIVGISELREVENRLIDVSIAVADENDAKALKQLRQTMLASGRFSQESELPPEPMPPKESTAISLFLTESPAEMWGQFLYELKILEQVNLEALTTEPPSNADTASTGGKSADSSIDPGSTERTPPMGDETIDDSGDTPPDSFETSSGAGESVAEIPKMEDEPNPDRPLPTLEQQLRVTIREFDSFKMAYCGGKSWAWLKLLANPTPEEAESYTKSITTFLREQLLTVGGATSAFLGRLVFGMTIMVISLFFFLQDGPKMIRVLRQLSPLDDEHESELIGEFNRVSRAVVVATLLAAIAQGILAGIGFYFAGLDNVFLLTILTVCLAMVPFFGAAAVWVPACLWLYLVDNRLGTAVGLAVYGFSIISTVDNLIKPYVLHGQSNIHPLLALLSVLGGVSALGPLGILIGPMIVVFLQTVLRILQRELLRLDRPLSLATAGSSTVELGVGSAPADGTDADLAPSKQTQDDRTMAKAAAASGTEHASPQSKPSGKAIPKKRRR